MRQFPVALAVFAFTLLGLALVDAQDRGKQDRGRVQPKGGARPDGGHRVVLPAPHIRPGPVERRAAELRRFDRPIIAPWGERPIRPGRSYHWHQDYGWVGLPAVGAPAGLVLPPNYAFPERVESWELPAPQTVQAVCPHCGQQFTIQLR